MNVGWRLLLELWQSEPGPWRTVVTKGAGLRTKGLLMAYKLLEMVQRRWRRPNGPHQTALGESQRVVRRWPAGRGKKRPRADEPSGVETSADTPLRAGRPLADRMLELEVQGVSTRKYETVPKLERYAFTLDDENGALAGLQKVG